MDIFDLTSFSAAFEWVIAHGYILMFFAMLIEGPVVTAAASFAVAFGYFNLFIIFVLSLLGDIVADVIYYAIGYFSRISVVERFGHYFGLTYERMDRIEKLLNNHPTKTLIALKLTPILPTPGLMIVGTTKMPLKKFVTLCSFIIIPKTVFFMLVGYYFGATYDILIKRFEKGGLIIILIVFLIAIIYYSFNKLSTYIARRIEKI
jgi:membrane protein DedA with SNARE-associated domain